MVILSAEYFDFISLNTEMLSTGFYFYEIMNEGKVSKKGKVIKCDQNKRFNI